MAKERPFTLTGPEVRAVLDRHKTQARRVLKMPDGHTFDTLLRTSIRHDNAPPYALYAQALKEGTNQGTWIRCPYSDGTQGDRLWVRERFCIGYDTDGTGRTFSALPWSGSDPQRDGKACQQPVGVGADFQGGAPWLKP